MKNKSIILSLVILFFAAILVIVGYFIKQNLTASNIQNKTVDIVFTSDKKYKEYLKVAIKSAIVNKNADTIYNIDILCVDLDEKDMESFKNFETENVHINIIPQNVANIQVGNYNVANHVSRADLFKFYLPSIINKDKVLYLDSDIIVKKDLLTLFNTDLKNKYLGAVYTCETVYLWRKICFIWFRYTRHYYNCGIMLLNLKQMREDDISEQLCRAKEYDTRRVLMTQSAFNKVIPAETIVALSPEYNVISRWTNWEIEKKEFKKVFHPFAKNINCINDLFENATIIHYAGYLKPWFYDDKDIYKEWWKYAKLVDPSKQKEATPPEPVQTEKSFF